MRVKKFDQINVLPFIDIMLVLLVIVLSSASFVSKSSLPVELPTAEGGSAPVEKMRTIAIDKEGHYFFDGERVDFKTLKQKVLALNPKKDALLIQSDAKSRFQRFVDVIDLLKRHGFEKVSIETRRE